MSGCGKNGDWLIHSDYHTVWQGEHNWQEIKIVDSNEKMLALVESWIDDYGYGQLQQKLFGTEVLM